VSLTIPAGERVVLAGPSGSGKSTLLSLLNGAVKPTSGEVLAGGRSLARFSPSELSSHRARCGLVLQGGSLVPQLTVHQNVVAGLVPSWSWVRVAAAAVVNLERARVRAILEQLGIGDRQFDPLTALSGGEQQRVAVARGLIADAPVILADEPTSALDPRTAALVASVLFETARTRRATLVFCTHAIELGVAAADRIVGVRSGRIVLDAKPADVDGAAIAALYAGSHDRP
jgi:phosphonate transport system ATP-binding protein